MKQFILIVDKNEYPREKSQGTKIKRRNKKGPRGNTALYECCLLGLDGAEPLRILLKHGGDAC
ncbi:unnamed protein product, partial [Rotaria sp. Silwood1]